jgi:hypothetical protein
MQYRIVALLILLFAADVAFGQATSTPVTVAFPQLAVGGDADGLNYVTIIQVVNNNSVSITGHIALFSDSGSALAVSFDGQAPQSTLDITLAPGATRQIQVTLNAAITVGWMTINYSPSDALTTVILQFRSGTTLLSEVGVNPAFDAIAATDFSAETDVNLNTGIAVANPSSSIAYVLARVWDANTGTSFTSTILTLPANGHTARMLTELFPNVLNISQIRAKISLDSCSSSSCSFAGGNGFLATAIRLNGPQFTTIPVTERAPGDATRVLPQVAFGGPANGLNMKTVLYFTTNVSTGVFGTADIFDNDGNPLAASADGAAPASSITFTVPGNRVSRIVLSGDQVLRSGWIRLTLPSSVNLVTNAVFQTFIGSNITSEASVLESAPINNGLIYVKVQSGVANVGVAFANPQADANTITVNLFNRDGFLAGTSDILLAANGHLARFLTELFPQIGSSDFDGALSIHSSSGFSALALRLSSDKLATLPVAENGMYRPSITALRITGTQRTGAQVSFQVDVTDFDSDVATSSSTSVSAVAYVDFGSSVGYDFGPMTIDGSAMLNRSTGTLSGTFKPPNVTQSVPSGFSATFYIVVSDSAGNVSNFVGLPFRY